MVATSWNAFAAGLLSSALCSANGATARNNGESVSLETASGQFFDAFPGLSTCAGVSPNALPLTAERLCGYVDDVSLSSCIQDCTAAEVLALEYIRDRACVVGTQNDANIREIILESVLAAVYFYFNRDGVYSLLAHASTDPTMDVLNVAYPDFSSEYWVSTFTGGDKPHFNGNFPSWADYAALTAYDIGGNVIYNHDGTPVSINSLQLSNDPRATLLDDGTYDVDIMQGIDTNGLIWCVLERIYRPPDRVIMPTSARFAVINEDPAYSYVQASVDTAVANSETIEPLLRLAISAATPSTGLLNSQMAIASTDQTQGVFPNANAQYLSIQVTAEVQAAILTGRVPNFVDWRPFYGFMVVDGTNTATYDSLSQYDLGESDGVASWGADYKLFVARTETDALAAGYDPSNVLHKVGYWGVGNAKPGIVMRIIRYYEANTGLNVAAAAAEREQLNSLNGTLAAWEEYGVSGLVPLVEYSYFSASMRTSRPDETVAAPA